MIKLNPDQVKDLVLLEGFIRHQYVLDDFTDKQLIQLQKAVNQSKREILRKLKKKKIGEWTDRRSKAVLNELERMTLGIQRKLTRDISDISTYAAQLSQKEYNRILSFDGMVKGFNNVSLSREQIKNYIYQRPVGGYRLKEWVSRTFNYEMKDRIRSEILTGALKGAGYPELVKCVGTSFDNLSKRSIITLVRTYVQEVNVQAQLRIFKANKDVVKGLKWSAVLENSYKGSGRGTCLRCAGLDGNIYLLDDHPPCPAHPRCRCSLLPETKSFRELGLDIDEIKKNKRPFAFRTDKNIDAGGRRKILHHGYHDGDYASWFNKQSDGFKLNALGPKRFELLQQGKIDFKDLVNPKNGELYTLKELSKKTSIGKLPTSGGTTSGGGLTGPISGNIPISFHPVTTIKKATEWAKKADLADNINYGNMDISVVNTMNKVIYEAEKEYPFIREKMKILGSYQEYLKTRATFLYEKMSPAIKKHNTLADVIRQHLKTYDNPNAWAASGAKPATTTPLAKKLQGIYWNEQWTYEKTFNSVIQTVNNGFHPIGTDSVKAIIDHEVGHVLASFSDTIEDQVIDYVSDHADIGNMINYVNDNLSKYASSDPGETVAEAWAEVVNNPSPRKMALDIIDLLKQGLIRKGLIK